jgi:hypothetical protein
VHFAAIPAYCPPTGRLRTPESPAGAPVSKNTSPKLHCPSAYDGNGYPILRLTVRCGVRDRVPASPEVPPLGFGYPFDGFSTRFLDGLFQPPTLWASPFRAFLLPDDRRKVSLPHPLVRFLMKPVRASHRRFSGFIPSEKPFPSMPPEFLHRVGDFCSPGFDHLSGSPSEGPCRGASPFPASPLVLPNPTALQPPRRWISGFLCLRPGISLRRGRRPVRCFRPTAVPHLLGE